MSVPGKCPDGGTCHSVGDECASSCYRVACCEPLSGVFPGDVWPENVKRAAAVSQDEDLMLDALDAEYKHGHLAGELAERERILKKVREVRDIDAKGTNNDPNDYFAVRLAGAVTALTFVLKFLGEDEDE